MIAVWNIPMMAISRFEKKLPVNMDYTTERTNYV